MTDSAYQRSRRPLIVFGRRGRLDRKSGWAVEERAVARPAQGEKYPTRYLGPWIPLDRDDADDAELREAFRALLGWLFVAPSIGAVGVWVPRWDWLPHRVQERLHVAVGCQLRGGGGPMGVELVPKADRLPVLHPTTSAPPQLKAAAPPPRFVTNPADHLAWLQQAVPSVEELTQVLAAFLGQNGQAPRTFDAARSVAAELRATGGRWTRPQVQTYLEVFGFTNSKDLVGVWPAKRLAEVAAVTPR